MRCCNIGAMLTDTALPLTPGMKLQQLKVTKLLTVMMRAQHSEGSTLRVSQVKNAHQQVATQVMHGSCRVTLQRLGQLLLQLPSHRHS